MSLRTKLLDFSIPISKAISYVCRPEMKVVSEELLLIESIIKNGDCLVSRTDWELSNYFLPGYWKHCAIYWNGWVYEATTHGVRKVLLAEFCFKKDHVGLIRPLFVYDISFNQQKWLNFTLGKHYDWTFSWMQNTSDAWYCSEYLYAFYTNSTGLDFFNNFRPRKILGEYSFAPSDYWLASKFFQQLYRTPIHRGATPPAPQISTIEEASESQQSPRSIQDSKKELHDFLDAINHE